MATQLGSGGFFYEEHDDWAQLPDGWTFHEAPDVLRWTPTTASTSSIAVTIP